MIFCSYRTDATGSLSSHLSRKHKIQTVALLNESIVHVSDAIASNSTQGSANLDNVSDSEEEDDLEDNSEITTDDLDGLFVKALAITVSIQCKEITLFFPFLFLVQLLDECIAHCLQHGQLDCEGSLWQLQERSFVYSEEIRSKVA